MPDSHADEQSDSHSDDNETSDTSSSEEDENAKEWTDEVEKTFLKTLSSLKKKDPKIYDGNVKFFQEELFSSKHPPAPKEKHLYLKDYERKIILEKNGILTDEESDEEGAHKIANERANSPTYVEEQRILKENFSKMLNDDSDNSEDDCAGFLKVKQKTAQEKAKEEADYIEWLKGQKPELDDKETEGELKFLRDYWTDPNLNEGEQFLRDYILNKRFLEPDQSSQAESELSFSEEERVLEECDEYEQKYNFRFEEPDKNFIKTYPRVIENSLRRKDEKRKLKREALKKRKEEKLEQKRLEVKRLKKQKKQEILEKIQKLKKITGNEELGFNDEDLQKDFSPDEYDKKMSELFNEEFYELADMDDEKPTFSDSDSFEYDEEEDDTADVENDDVEYEDTPLNEENITNEDSTVIMDCDYNPNQQEVTKFKRETRSSRRKGHKKSKFMEVVRKEKPVFNATEKTFQQYLDEYYNLDFEDMIGDMPCRFKYRKVPANDFGLTVEEILAADDKELNKWCSMKKIDTLRPENMEKFDKKIYARKAVDLNLKKKILPSLFQEDQQTENEPNADTEQKKKSKKKKNRRKSKIREETSVKESTDEVSSNKPIKKSTKKKSDNQSTEINHKKLKNTSPTIANKKKSIPSKKFSKMNNDKAMKKPFKRQADQSAYPNPKKKRSDDNCEIPDERLKAYGINPKRYKNKLKYGPK